MDLTEFRKRYPEFKKVDDHTLSRALWEEHFQQDSTWEEFQQKFVAPSYPQPVRRQAVTQPPAPQQKEQALTFEQAPGIVSGAISPEGDIPQAQIQPPGARIPEPIAGPLAPSLAQRVEDKVLKPAAREIGDVFYGVPANLVTDISGFFIGTGAGGGELLSRIIMKDGKIDKEDVAAARQASHELAEKWRAFMAPPELTSGTAQQAIQTAGSPFLVAEEVKDKSIDFYYDDYEERTGEKVSKEVRQTAKDAFGFGLDVGFIAIPEAAKVAKGAKAKVKAKAEPKAPKQVEVTYAPKDLPPQKLKVTPGEPVPFPVQTAADLGKKTRSGKEWVVFDEKGSVIAQDLTKEGAIKMRDVQRGKKRPGVEPTRDVIKEEVEKDLARPVEEEFIGLGIPEKKPVAEPKAKKPTPEQPQVSKPKQKAARPQKASVPPPEPVSSSKAPGAPPPTKSIKAKVGHIRFALETIEAGKTTGKITRRGQKSEFPKFFKGKGYKSADAQAALKKALKGEKLTSRQVDMVNDLLEASRRDYEKVGIQKSKVDPTKIPDGSTVVIDGIKYKKSVDSKTGDIVLRDGETIRRDAFDKPLLVDEVIKPKITQPKKGQQELIGVPKDTMKGKIPTKEVGETPLERGVREAKGRKIEAEETAKQGKLTSEPKALADSLGKGNEIAALEKMGVKDKAAQTQFIIDDAVRSKVNQAKAFEKRGDKAEAKKLMAEAKDAAAKLKATGDPGVSKQVDKALRGGKPKGMRSAKVETSEFAANQGLEKPGRMAELESAAREEIARELPDKQIPIGLSTEIVGEKPIKPPKRPEVKSTDPAVEKRIKAAETVPQMPVSEKIGAALTSFKNKLTRDFEHLPRTKQWAEIRKELHRLKKQKGVSQDRASWAIYSFRKDLDKPAFDAFSRKVLLDNLKYNMDNGHALQFGYKPETLTKDLAQINKDLAHYPEAVDALAKRKAYWDALKEDYTKAFKEIGVDVSERLKNPDYFRQMTLDHINLEGLFGTGQKLKTPKPSYLRERKKTSTKDFLTDYVEAEHNVISQILYDIEVAGVIKEVRKHDIYDNVKAKLKPGEKVLDNIPDGHEAFYPDDGNVFHVAMTVPERIIRDFSESMAQDLKITPSELRQALAVGGKRRPLIVPEGLAATLENLRSREQAGLAGRVSKYVHRKWKIWQLLSPRRVGRYNIRNMTGDLDAVVAGNPNSLKFTPRAVRDLYDVYVSGKPMTKDMFDWFSRGGMESLMTAEEIGSVRKIKLFEDLYKKKNKVSEVPMKVWKGYWKSVRTASDFREAMLRYASYLSYLDQMRKNPKGLPKNYGASIREEIKGLRDPKDRAFKLSNDLLGAYDELTVFGQTMREHIAPFWSWNEVNFKRYKRLFENTMRDSGLATAAGRTVMRGMSRSPIYAARLGLFSMKVGMFYAAIQMWNHMAFPELEGQLSEDKKNRPHIILGKDDEGQIVYFDRIGAFGDILEWFGLDTLPSDANAVMTKRMTMKEYAKKSFQAPINKLFQSLSPVYKLPGEIASRRSFYPDVFQSGTIRDMGLHIARSFGLGEEYKVLADLPRKPYSETLDTLLLYKADPLENSYHDAYELKRSFLKKKGKLGEGFYLTPRGHELYLAKQWVKFGDMEKARRHFLQYFQKGGTEEGINKSLENMAPLAGLNKQERTEFLAQLTEEERNTLTKAHRFYLETLLGMKREKKGDKKK